MTDTLTPAIHARPPGPIEFRAATIADVDMRERIVQVIAVPYNEEAIIEYPARSGRTIIESVLPGAFEGIETRPEKRAITVNRDHDYARTIGVARTFHPSRSEGLVTDLKISLGPSGDDALGLAGDGALSASVGMSVYKNDQRWSADRSHRQILRAFLDHVALVPVPAYAGARVLAVRDDARLAEVATPYLDEAIEYAAKIADLLRLSRDS